MQRISKIMSAICQFFLLANVSSAASLHPGAIPYTDVGSGKPIILIHAFPTDQNLWLPQREGLQKHFRVITLDLSGFGKSTPVDGSAITMSEYADRVHDVLNQLHVDSAVIGGESMGGYIALAFLEKYPEKTSGLILSGTQAIGDSAEAKAKREASAQDVLTNGTAGLIAGFLPKALSPDASASTREYLKTILDAQSASAMASALRGMAIRKDLSNLLSESYLPILIITGDADVLVSPKQSEAMQQLAHNSKLVKIAKAGHLASLEKPNEWNQAVYEYFGK